MSTTTEVSIANVALAAIGQATITLLTDSNARANRANTLIEPVRDALLEDHDWNFATKRVVLTIPESAHIDMTAVATQANPVVITAAAHGLSDGDSVNIIDMVDMTDLNGRVFEIQNKATNTFELKNENGLDYSAHLAASTISTTDNLNPVAVVTSAAHGLTTGDVVNITGVSTMTEINNRRFTVTVTSTTGFTLDDEDGTGYTDGTGGTVMTGSARKVPAFGPDNEFTLPSDFIRITRSAESTDKWRIENGFVVTDDTSVSIVYMAKITDVTVMSEGFKQAWAMRLARDMARPLTGDSAVVKEAAALYKAALSKAMLNDSLQRSRTTVGGKTWVDGRLDSPPEGQPSGWADSV